MLKYVSKIAMDILPSVVATIIGAYIVNHYIVTKPGADAPVAAAVSSADPKKVEIKNDARLSETSADAGQTPVPGVTAKGISEKAMFEKTAAERPAVAEKPADKSGDKQTETASIPADTRRHPPVSREKTAARTVPAQPAPVVAAPNTAPSVEAAIAPEEHRDANDLARAAIERLRGAGDGSPRAQETARIPDAPRVVLAPAVTSPVASAPPVRPLPPPIMVSTPPTQPFDQSSGSAQINDPSRPTPPADIPQAAAPLDLRAEAVEPQRRGRANAADVLLAAKEDMLSAAKSVFHAVLPK